MCIEQSSAEARVKSGSIIIDTRAKNLPRLSLRLIISII